MADTNTTEFLKSLEAKYLDGHYQQVLESFYAKGPGLLDDGFLYYNLGSLHAQLENWSAGRYYLEKAIIHGDFSNQTQNNLAFVRENLQVFDLTSSERLSDRLMDFFLTTPFNAFLTFSLVILFIYMVVLLWKELKFLSFKSLLVFLVAGLPLGAAIYAQKFELAVNVEAIALRQGPSDIYEVEADLQAGSKVIVGEHYNNWVMIVRPQELTGWVKKSELNFLRSGDLLEGPKL